jgi:hypothetical protein
MRFRAAAVRTCHSMLAGELVPCLGRWESCKTVKVFHVEHFVLLYMYLYSRTLRILSDGSGKGDDHFAISFFFGPDPSCRLTVRGSQSNPGLRRHAPASNMLPVEPRSKATYEGTAGTCRINIKTD